MQTHEYFISEKGINPLADEPVDTYTSYIHAPLAASAFNAVLPPSVRQIPPFERVEVQRSVGCPENFIIFDQTDQQSRILFHPAMTFKFNSPGFNVHATCTPDYKKKEVNQMERELSSPFEEDSDDIDALLSLEVDELEDFHEEVVSTARTDENYESLSDTCCSYYSILSKKRPSSSSLHKSFGTRGYCNNERKHREMKKMLRMLRRIVPGGGDRMDTITVLDEAVKYLKSLKVEVEQFRVGK